jgi:hypothetical protein
MLKYNRIRAISSIGTFERFGILGDQVEYRPGGSAGAGLVGHNLAGGLGLADLAFVLLYKGVYLFIRNGIIGIIDGLRPFFDLIKLFDKDIEDFELIHRYPRDPFRGGDAGNMLKMGIDIT